MNLSEERNYQKLLSTLEAMELSQVNMHLAQQYLDMTREKQPELLTQAEHQDFSGLDKEKCRKCLEYIEHCNKRGRKEEAKRIKRSASSFRPRLLQCSIYSKHFLHFSLSSPEKS